MVDIENLIKNAKALTLLYVEDDKESRESTLLILEEIFDNIVVAVDGSNGVEKFKNNKIDLILTDIDMPNMNGFEMSKLIKQIDNNQSIIVLTALTDIKIVKNAIDIGIDSFINKPIENIDILFNKIEQIIKKIQYDEEKKDREKVKLVYKMIHNIAHHWRQPLSIISTISSSCSTKRKLGIKLNDKDFKGADIITKKVEELSNILSKIESLDFDTVKIEDIEKLIKISNPIYDGNIDD